MTGLCDGQVRDATVGWLRVEVTDTGAGIALENQKNVFGEFTQFDRNKLQGGGMQQLES